MKTKSLIPLPIAALAVLFCAPMAGAQVLFEAGEFALLGGTSIVNNGATEIHNGDIGLWNGTSISGFQNSDPVGPGVLVDGVIRPVSPDEASKPGMEALIKLQNGLAAMTPDAILGNQLAGQELLPGVYQLGAADLTGDLVLNGNGQNNAFWVFQIGSTFVTGANAKITVINAGSNGGSDYGVFWNAGTGITTGADSELLGNFLAGTTITMGARSFGSGRALALTDISLDANNFDVFGGPGGGDWSGGLMYNEFGEVVAIPEASTYAVLFGFAALVMVGRRRMPKVG